MSNESLEVCTREWEVSLDLPGAEDLRGQVSFPVDVGGLGWQ
jgi:hypothetical protein